MSEIPTILVVDDDPDIRATVSALYGTEGRVLTAASGEEALAHLASASPRLMILDLSMPGMSGLEVLRSAMALRPGLPVFMLTSEQDVEAARSALAAGARQFITKPFDIEYLRSEILKVLGGSEPDPTGGAPWKHAE